MSRQYLEAPAREHLLDVDIPFLLMPLPRPREQNLLGCRPFLFLPLFTEVLRRSYFSLGSKSVSVRDAPGIGLGLWASRVNFSCMQVSEHKMGRGVPETRCRGHIVWSVRRGGKTK